MGYYVPEELKRAYDAGYCDGMEAGNLKAKESQERADGAIRAAKDIRWMSELVAVIFESTNELKLFDRKGRHVITVNGALTTKDPVGLAFTVIEEQLRLGWRPNENHD